MQRFAPLVGRIRRGLRRPQTAALCLSWSLVATFAVQQYTIWVLQDTQRALLTTQQTLLATQQTLQHTLLAAQQTQQTLSQHHEARLDVLAREAARAPAAGGPRARPPRDARWQVVDPAEASDITFHFIGAAVRCLPERAAPETLAGGGTTTVTTRQDVP